MYSTLYINKYCTGEPSEITWPQEIPLTSLEQKLTAQAMKGFDLGLCQAILLEAQQRIIQKQDVKNRKVISIRLSSGRSRVNLNPTILN